MSNLDLGHLRMLADCAKQLAESDGPISPVVGAQVLTRLSAVIVQRGPLSMRTLESVVHLIEALREDITA